MRFASFPTSHIAKLLENGHDGQLLTLDLFAEYMPRHQILQGGVA